MGRGAGRNEKLCLIMLILGGPLGTSRGCGIRSWSKFGAQGRGQTNLGAASIESIVQPEQDNFTQQEGIHGEEKRAEDEPWGITTSRGGGPDGRLERK